MPSTNVFTGRRGLVSVVLGAIALLVVFLIVQSRFSTTEEAPGGDSAGFLVPRPRSVEDLVARAAVVVIGTIDNVQRETEEGPFTFSTPEPGAPPFPKSRFTYYSVKVESVVTGSDQVAPGQEITLRVNGVAKDSEMAGGEMRMPRPGDRRLLVLESDPLIPDAYFPHPWGIFRIDGAMARYDDVDKTPVDTFTTASSPPAFADALRTAKGGGP